MTAEAAGLFLDYSKNRITNETVKLLLKLADEIDSRLSLRRNSSSKSRKLMASETHTSRIKSNLLKMSSKHAPP
jgi:glucose-6-phosphate isomerase